MEKLLSCFSSYFVYVHAKKSMNKLEYINYIYIHICVYIYSESKAIWFNYLDLLVIIVYKMKVITKEVFVQWNSSVIGELDTQFWLRGILFDFFVGFYVSTAKFEWIYNAHIN